MKIGFIGLGIMGRPMALNLKNARPRLIVPERDSLTAEFARRPRSWRTREPSPPAPRCVFLIVPDTPDVEAALFGTDGVAEGIKRGQPGDRHDLDQSDRHQGIRQEDQGLGCEYLDAPVSGGEVGAKQASLTIMVGGPDRIRPGQALFELMGKNITHVGRTATARPARWPTRSSSP